MRAWRAAHPEQWREAQRRYRKKNASKFCEYSRRWRESHPGGNTASCNRWRRANAGRFNAYQAKINAEKSQRTPSWADMKKIEQIYIEARAMSARMGEPWHVDHVVPLRGRKVSGLHVHYNLQLLPGADNVRKHNKFEVE